MTYEALVDYYLVDNSYRFVVTKDEKFILLNSFYYHTPPGFRTRNNIFQCGFLMELNNENNKNIFERYPSHFEFGKENTDYDPIKWIENESELGDEFYEFKITRTDLGFEDNLYLAKADLEEGELTKLNYTKTDFKLAEYQKGFMLNQDLGL